MSDDQRRDVASSESRLRDLRHEEQSEDYYMDGNLCVFTAAFHLKRGFCCGSGCRHCPYQDGDEEA